MEVKMKKLSVNVQKMKPSPLLEFDKTIKKLLSEKIYPWGKPIFMNIGQPDFSIPEILRESLAEEIKKEGNNFYLPVAGLDTLKNGIAAYLKKTQGVDFDPNMMVITNGAKEAIYLSLSVLVGNEEEKNVILDILAINEHLLAGEEPTEEMKEKLILAQQDLRDQVIAIAPFWPSYEQIVPLVNGNFVVVNSPEDFHLDLDAIETAITKRTKAIIINTPNNPSGIVYIREELEKLAEIAKKHDVIIISDEVYSTLIYGDQGFCSMGSIEKARDRTIVVNAFSKSDSVTGFRIGYLIAPNKEILDAVLKIKSNSTGNTDSFMQYAFARALSEKNVEGLIASEKEMKADFEKRGGMLSKGLREIGIGVSSIKGAFYVFAPIPAKYSHMTSVEFTTMLAKKTGVVVSPGEYFGGKYNKHIRFSFASSTGDIKEAVMRMKEFLKTGVKHPPDFFD